MCLCVFRNCGNVFCKDCCHLKLPIPEQQLYDSVLVCNTCHDLLLESRTRELRSQQLKKAIATASSWEARCRERPGSVLFRSFQTSGPSVVLEPRPAVVLWELRRICFSVKRIEGAAVSWRQVVEEVLVPVEPKTFLSPECCSVLLPPPKMALSNSVLSESTCPPTVPLFRGQSLRSPWVRRSEASTFTTGASQL